MTQADPGAREAAAAFRQEHHLGTAPIADLVTTLEAVPGIHVAIEPECEGDHHGMRATDPERGVTILGAVATPHAVRLRSTLAHELGHHVFGDPTPMDWSERSPAEERATEFARHLLIPVEGLRELLGDPGDTDVTEAVLSVIVERFAVSPHLAGRQLREAGFIDEEAAERFAALSTPALATRYGWMALYRQWSTDSTTVRPPRRIAAASISAYIDHESTLATVANIHGVSPDEMKTALEAASVRPGEVPGQDEADDSALESSVDWGALDDTNDEWSESTAGDEVQ